MLIRLARNVPAVFQRLRRDERGVGAVEFAIIFPLLLALYISAFELTIAFSQYKRATTAAGTIADLVAQQKIVDKAFLSSTTHAAEAIFAPYSSQGLKLKLTGILTDAAGKAKVHWSWDDTGARPYQVGSEVNLPSAMRNPDRFFVRAELSIPHSILRFMTTLETAIQPFTITKDYVFEKRQDDAITCANC